MSGWQDTGDARDKDIQVPDLSAWHSLPRGFIGGTCTYAPTVCPAWGLSCFLQKGRGGGRHLEGREGR